MRSPLVSRPAYGDGRANIPISESKLPHGDPGGKGLSLDPDIPGSSTFSKPEGDSREPSKAPGSIYRVDGPDSLAKPQSDPAGDRIDHQDFKPSIGAPGGRPKDDQAVTKYPYRDDKPNAHNASAEFVLGCYLLKTAHESVIPAMTRTAATISEMSERLDPKTVQRATKCAVTLKRVDVPKLRWLLSVDCGNGAKVVRIKATRDGKTTKFSKMDLAVSCSCPGWRWLGPEHHAKKDAYLDGKQVGTASIPVIKDPEGVHTVCKHVAAVLTFTKGWDIPKPKG